MSFSTRPNLTLDPAFMAFLRILNSSHFSSSSSASVALTSILHTLFHEGDYPQLINLIESKKENINFQDKEGNTVLHLALQGGHTILTRTLLAAGAQTHLKNNENKTAIMVQEEIQHNEARIESTIFSLPSSLQAEKLPQNVIPPKKKVILTEEMQQLTRAELARLKKIETEEVVHQISYLYSQLNEQDQACLYFESILKRHPKWQFVTFELIKLYAFRNGEFKTPLEREKRQIELTNKLLLENKIGSKKINRGAITVAQQMLGYVYCSGSSELRNYPKACEMFFNAAEEGDTRIQFNLGGILLLLKEENPHLKMHKKFHDANYWYSKAAEQGCATSQTKKGILLFKEGEQKNEEEAFEFFQKAAKQNHPMALEYLGIYYEKGLGGLEPNKHKALEYYQLSIDNPNESYDSRGARFKFGCLSLKMDDDLKKKKITYMAEGFKTLYATANHLYLVNSIFEVGLCYLNGLGVLQDEAAAFKYIRHAAVLGLTKAQHQLGILLAAGLLEQKKEAKKWLRMAALAGDGEASIALENLLSKHRALRDNWERPIRSSKPRVIPEAKTIETKDEKKEETKPVSDITKLKHEAKNNNPSAEYQLALFYKSIGVPKKANKFFARAEEHGYVNPAKKIETWDEKSLTGSLDLFPEKFRPIFSILQKMTSEIEKLGAELYVKGSNVPYVIKKILHKKPILHPTRPQDIDLEINCYELKLDIQKIELIFTRLGFVSTYHPDFISLEREWDNKIKVQATLIRSSEYELSETLKPMHPRLRLFPNGRFIVVKMTAENLQLYLNNLFETELPFLLPNNKKRYTYFYHRLINACEYFHEDTLHENTHKAISNEYMQHHFRMLWQTNRYDFYGEIAALIKNKILTSPIAKNVIIALSAILLEEFTMKMGLKNYGEWAKLVKHDIFYNKLLKNLHAINHPYDGLMTSYIRYISSTVISTFLTFYPYTSESADMHNTIYNDVIFPSFKFMSLQQCLSSKKRSFLDIENNTYSVQMFKPILLSIFKSTVPVLSEKIHQCIADYVMDDDSITSHTATNFPHHK